MELYYHKEEALLRAQEMVGEAVEELAEILPDTAAELGWIWEGLQGELIAMRSAENYAADGEKGGEEI